jgi:hypothetical protein
MLNPSTSCYFQGSQILRVDSRIEVRDAYNNILHRFPIADSGPIADQGEFSQQLTLTTASPSYLVDEVLTGYSGNTPATDMDLLWIQTSAPVMLRLGEGIPLNSVTPGSRNPNCGVIPVETFNLLRTNSPSTIVLEEGFDQRLLPFKVYIANGVTTANITIYMAKFSLS